MSRQKPSNNFRKLRTIMSKMRQLESSRESQYLIIYSFFYKYCSDMLKNYLSDLCREKSVTLNKAYNDEFLKDFFRNESLKEFGYFINNPNCFFEDIVYNCYSEDFFIYAVYDSFRNNVEFREDSKYKEYFDFIFEEVSHAVNFNKFEFTNPNHLIVKEIMYSISELDVFEERFPFEKVFDRLCQSRFIDADHDPDYISNLISSIVTSKVKNPTDIYNPFLNDASLLINLNSDYGYSWMNTYAKSHDKFTYCCSIIKLLMYDFDLDNVYSEFGSPFAGIEDLSIKFDVILSRFPSITSRNIKMLSFNQSYRILKQNKVNQVKSLLSDKLNIDEGSFENNSELNIALENLIDKMDWEFDLDAQFVGEYEVLKDSEYLFLINMINSLKDDGIMVVGMHQSFLVKNSLETLRKFLTFEKNYVDAIISIPDELSRPSRLQIIMVFRKNRKSDDIVFIDLSKNFKTKKSQYAVPGALSRNLVLDDSTTSKVMDVYSNRKVIDKFSNVVNIANLEANDFNLSISRYVDTFEGEFIKLEELKNQKAEIDENMKKLNKKIDLMMKELDIRL